MRFEVLGRIAVSNGQPVDVGSGRQRRLLAALLVQGDRSVSIGELVDMVWADGEAIPDHPDRSLRTYVSRLRASLTDAGDVIETTDDGYRLRLRGHELDAEELEQRVASAATALRAGRPDDAAPDVQAALALWGGRPFGPIGDEPWARPEADRLEELHQLAQEQRLDVMAAQGAHHEVVAAATRLVADHPLREGFRRHLIVALHRSGRTAEALRAYHDYRSWLATEVGLEPSPALQALERRIVSGTTTGEDGLTGTTQKLRAYELVERIGEGAFAIVFRGSQPSLGRDVAVKQIREELANRPEFIRRFEAEAHMVARLEHPHVVPLYDYWREPRSAYLVMRWLRGGTLEQRLFASPLSLDEARTMVTQVGSALSAAHRANVVHRDVKPANIFLDGDGNYFLGDFGIALAADDRADPSAALSAGSPAYAAPEQLRREAVGPPADVHGLAIATFEALTGQLPFAEELTQAGLLQRQLHEPIPSVHARRPELAPALDAVLQRATAKDPADRHPRVEDFVADFAAALDTDAPTTARRAAAGTLISDLQSHNPYKGLLAFDEADATEYFGRERLVDRLVDRLAASDASARLLAVVGPSGSGKSSVVHAGLLPALRRGRVPGSDRWFVAGMVPGRDPFGELDAALARIATMAVPDLAESMMADPRGIGRAVRRSLPAGGELLLVVDQFEELFTLVEDEPVRQRFIDGVVAALVDPHSQLRVVCTLRADFWDRPLRYGELARLLDGSAVPVMPLQPDELERAIVDPAHALGAEFEPGLVSEIVADVADQPGALPMLQYALTELWERRVSGLLTRDAYRRLGGVTGALAATAERLYTTSSEAEQAASRRLFGRLVTLGEGVEDTRRRVLRTELGGDPALDAVLERLGTARLLSFDRDPLSREQTVEVAHEALLREWPRLRTWLLEDRDGLRILRHLTVAASAWQTSGADAGELYRGGRLEAAETWAAEHGGELNEAERAFVHASVQRRRDEQAAERRQLRRLRGALVGVGVVAVVAVVAGLLALRQQGRADREATRAGEQAELASASAAEAETRRMVADAAAIVGENRDVALLLASEAHRRDPSPQTLAGLQRVLTSTGAYLGTIGAGVDHLAGGWLDDGTIVGVTKDDVRFYDKDTWQVTATLSLPAPVFTAVIGRAPVHVGGALVAVGTERGSVLVVEHGAAREIPVSRTAIRSVAAKDKQLVVGDTDGVVHLLDMATGTTRWSTQVMLERSYRTAMGEESWAALPTATSTFLASFDEAIFGAGPSALAVSVDGSVVAAAGTSLRRLDPGTGTITRSLLLTSSIVVGATPIPRNIPDVAVRPDGSLVVQAGSNGAAEVAADLTSARFGYVPTGRGDSNVPASALALLADGKPLFGLSNGQLAPGIVDDPLDAAANVATGLATIRALEPAPAGGTVLVVGPGGMVLWATDGRQLLARAAARGGHDEAWIDPTGNEVIATSFGNNPARFYDLTADPPRRRELPIDLAREWSGDSDPLRRFYLAGGTSPRWIDRKTLAIAFEIDDATFNNFSPDGRLLAAAAFSRNAVRVYETGSWQQVTPPIDLSEWAPADERTLTIVPAFDATGARLAASLSTGTTVLFDTTSWKVLHVIDASDHGGVVSVRFSRDGSTLVTLGTDGSIAVRDPGTYAVQRMISGGTTASDTLANGAYISPDSQYLITTRDAAPRLWHLPTSTLIGGFPHETGSIASGNDLGERLLLATLSGEHVLVWDLDVDAWASIACRAAGRNFTVEEWRQFGPKDVPYQQTCPQWAPAA